MDIILLLKTVLLGIVEGITEWLPISSTGHLILADEFIKLNMTGAFKEMFDVVIQLGAIMAVVVLYFHKLNPFSPKKNHREKMDTIVLWTKVILAVFPAAIIGILFDDWLNAHFYNPPVVAAMLIIYGILFIIIENRNKRIRRRPMNDLTRLSYGMALGIGVFQVLALIPGTSRSGATRNLTRVFQNGCCRILIFLRNSSNVWSKFIKDREIWSCIYNNTIDRTDRWNGSILPCIYRSDQVFTWIY